MAYGMLGMMQRRQPQQFPNLIGQHPDAEILSMLQQSQAASANAMPSPMYSAEGPQSDPNAPQGAQPPQQPQSQGLLAMIRNKMGGLNQLFGGMGPISLGRGR